MKTISSLLPGIFTAVFFCTFAIPAASQSTFVLEADNLFDGTDLHHNWSVIINGNRISTVGPSDQIESPESAVVLSFTDATILPGLIEGHSHVLLHPYDETSWNDQVLVESEAERVARGVNHLRKTLEAGFTTIRDLGSEGAGYADVGLKTTVEKNIIPGPRMIVSGRAIVATGSYGPKGFHSGVRVPLGAEAADGARLQAVTRDQIGKGADFIKVYADYRWGPGGTAEPTFSEDELSLIVATAKSSGRQTVAHASSPEGMRRAILAGVTSIEHGDDGTQEIWDLMKEKGVVLYPTIAAGYSISTYNGWDPSTDEPPRVKNKAQSFREAVRAGVTIGMGGDVGVYPHGENALEMELMVNYGMTPLEVLRSATSVNADTFELASSIGRIKPGLLADIVVVSGNPIDDVTAIRDVLVVIKDGEIIVDNRER